MTDSFPTPEEQWEFNKSRHQDCPKCGEDNPIEAVMCWACYTPLGAEAEDAQAQRQARERAVRFETGLEEVLCVLPFGGILLLIASGYGRKVRLPLIGAGLFTLALSLGWSKRRETKAARIAAQEPSPTERIADTILLYAVLDGASKIRLRAGIGVCVHYLIGDDWREQMKIPGYAWSDLRAHFLRQSERWTQPISFEINDRHFEFSSHFEREHDLPLETLTLSLLP